jgi:predicted nucleic acid-binding protein
VDFYYFDASALVKAYIWEVGTDDVRQVLREARAATPAARILTSRIAYAEAMSAVSRREAAGQLTRQQATESANRLQTDFAGPVLPYVILDPTLRSSTTRQTSLASTGCAHWIRFTWPPLLRRGSTRGADSASVSVPRTSV